LIVTELVFRYIWPERALDRLRDILRQVLGQLSRLLAIPNLETPVIEAKAKAEALVKEISRELGQARREAELTSFEIGGPRPAEGVLSGHLQATLLQIEHLLALAASLTKDSAWQEWQQLRPEAQQVESELRSVIAEYENFRS
jgi:hypothetical protein